MNLIPSHLTRRFTDECWTKLSKELKGKGKGNVDLYSAYIWNISKALRYIAARIVKG